MKNPSSEPDASNGTRHSRHKQQQAATPSSIMMGMIEAITDCNRCNQSHHCEAPKRSQDEHPSNATRRAVAKPQGGLADKRDKVVVRLL
jgi:hypothetical protein